MRRGLSQFTDGAKRSRRIGTVPDLFTDGAKRSRRIGTVPDLFFACGLPPEKAIEYFKSKGYTFSWDWHDTWQEAHARAFTVAKAMRMDVLQDIRDMVQKSLDVGITFQQFKKELEPKLKARGWWGRKIIGDETGAKEVQLGSPHRLKTIYRANLQTAYMAGRYKEQMENVDERPWWMYVAIMDSRTRPAHAALNGKSFRYDDPFWQTHFPPNGFRCRCRVRALSDKNLQDRGLKPETSEGKLSEVDRLVSKTTGEISPVTVYTDPLTGERIAPDAGWNYNPGKAAWMLDVMAYKKALDLQEPARSWFINEMATTDIYQKVFPGWVNNILDKKQASGDAITAGWMKQEVLDKLAKKGIVPETPVIAVNDHKILHMQREIKQAAGKALSIGEIRAIPEMLRSEASAVLLDKLDNDVIIYAFESEDKKTKLVVELNYRLKKQKTTVNLIKSSGRVDAAKLKDKNRYELIYGKL